MRFVHLALVFSVIVCVWADEPRVNTTFGPVRGIWLRTARDARIAGFLGLPYARPPVADLRFENPRPWKEKWTDIRNATSDGSMCLQVTESGDVQGDEDCLYLNVFVPAVANSTTNTTNNTKKLSVLVFVHGGAFNTGSSNSKFLAPTYLLDHEIILVTLNYRLNVLGFFSSGNEVTPGNYGLKDIVMALTWVRDNIESFGGDPNSVTLAGQSSAAASVLLLSASKATEGLFHKLITMSGSPTAPWAFHSRANIRNSSMHVTKLVGCDIEIGNKVSGGIGATKSKSAMLAKNTDVKIKECMKKANAKEIVEKSYFYVWRRNPVCVFGPTLEAEAEGAILTVHPVESLRKGLFRDMPWITGVTDDEGLLKTTDIFLNSEIKTELLQNYKSLLVPYVLEMEDKIANVSEVTRAIENFYFNGSIETYLERNITQLVGDSLVTWFSYDFLQKRVAQMKSNAYFYLFAYEGTFSNTFRYNIPFYFGAAHGDDLNYIFPYLNAKFADLQLNNTIADNTITNILCEMFTSFMKTGVPYARLIVTWEPYQLQKRYMKFGDDHLTDRSIETNFLTDRMRFWNDLIKKFSSPITEYRVGDKGDRGAATTNSLLPLTLGVCMTIILLSFNTLS